MFIRIHVSLSICIYVYMYTYIGAARAAEGRADGEGAKPAVVGIMMCLL